jgi:hypothetical protein
MKAKREEEGVYYIAEEKRRCKLRKRISLFL